MHYNIAIQYALNTNKLVPITSGVTTRLDLHESLLNLLYNYDKPTITSLGDLHFSCAIHNLPPDLSLESEVLKHKAVMSRCKELANIGDFTKVLFSQVSNASSLIF